MRSVEANALWARAIAAWMARLGFTSQRKFAELIEKDPGQVSRWLQGMGARDDTKQEVAERLGVTLPELLGAAYGPATAEVAEDPQERRVLLHYRKASAEKRRLILKLVEAAVENPNVPDELSA